MRRTGEPVQPGEVVAICTPPTLRDPVVDHIYAVLLTTIPAGHALSDDMGWLPGLVSLGSFLADRAGLAEPVGFLAHHAVELGWHRDRQAPRSTWNITVMLRPANTADYLVIDQEAWLMTHGSYVAFNNQRWHGCYRYDGTDRIALSYYVPSPGGTS